MVKILYIVMILLVCGGAFAVESKKSFEDYKAITMKNIFSRQRLSAKSKEEIDAAKNGEKKFVLEAFILRGTAINDSNKIAFVENVFDNEIYHIKVGEEFKGSVINDISNDGITITKDATASEIFIGGQFSGDKKVEDTGGAAKAEPVKSKSDSASSGDKQSDIEKQMMERRKKQLGK